VVGQKLPVTWPPTFDAEAAFADKTYVDFSELSAKMESGLVFAPMAHSSRLACDDRRGVKENVGQR
jgi:hypothetical protein